MKLIGYKPKVTRCGNHWAVDYWDVHLPFPIARCFNTWAEAVGLALKWAADAAKKLGTGSGTH